jgi:hypothetical protein
MEAIMRTNTTNTIDLQSKLIELASRQQDMLIEQQEQIDKLEERIAALEERLAIYESDEEPVDEEKTIREIYDTDKIDLAFYRIEHKMNFFISLDDDLYNTFLELYDKPLSYITCHKLNLIYGMIHIIQGIMNISHVLYDRSPDYSDDIFEEAKEELEKILEDRLNQYK